MADPNRFRAGPKQAASRPTSPTAAPKVAGSRRDARGVRCYDGRHDSAEPPQSAL